MNIRVAPTPTISDIKVTSFDGGSSGQGLRIEWLNDEGKRCGATRFGLKASRVLDDLHVAETIGYNSRRCFLIGWIRGLADGGGLDD